MLARDGRLLAIIAVALIGAYLMWANLQPRQPDLPAYEYGKGAAADYQPGGSKCGPTVLAAIRDNRKAATERGRCSEATEEHRLKSDDLVQQTRAANAAEAQAKLAHYIARLTLLGTIGGFLTLIAASVAAYFARDAAKASWGLLSIERARARSEPWMIVYFDVEAGDTPQRLKIVVKGQAETEASDVNVSNVLLSTSDKTFTNLKLTLDEVTGPSILASKGQSRHFLFSDKRFVFGAEEMARGDFDKLEVTVKATLEFKDWAGEKHSITQEFSGAVNPITSFGNPPPTVRLQASHMPRLT